MKGKPSLIHHPALRTHYFNLNSAPNVTAAAPRALCESRGRRRGRAFGRALLRGRRAFEALDLDGREVSPLADEYAFGRDGAYADAPEFYDGVVDEVEHAAYLLVPAL